MDTLEFKLLSVDQLSQIVSLTHQLNKNRTLDYLKNLQKEMFTYNHYNCFGLYKEVDLIGVSSGWITVRLYSGKQLELDNVVIDENIQSSGMGTYFLKQIESWAKAEGCETIELNTYINNSRSHKFYFNQGYKIIGYHFQKQIG
jgi:hypothetical protein